MTAQPQANSGVLSRYRERVERSTEEHSGQHAGDSGDHRGISVDEWLSDAGTEQHQQLTDIVESIGIGGLLARKAATARHIKEDGLTYTVSGEDRARPWQLDPLPVVLSDDEWARLERGLTQRAMLLDALLGDLYGERRMISEGVIPAAAVVGHDGFLPAADGIRLPGDRQLVMTSVDLARDASGTWTVLADRNQAPSGAGYAMADRRIVARTMPRLYRNTALARLRGFFDQMSDALLDAAPVAVDQPNIALLSPGPASETAFDQAFLASLLGLPVVQAEDLTMRDGRVWRQTTHKPQHVDVLVRRVDAAWSDPLDLRGDSRLGVTGLTEAARRGMISVVNPLGSGVLENPALVPFLPQAAKRLLGEDLLLPDARTWWFGDREQRAEAMDRLDELVIKPISRGEADPATHGWELSSSELDDLRVQIEAEPWKWAAQEQVAMSTAPVIAAEGLEPRRLVLRTFGVGANDGYRFLPGGLGRVAANSTSWNVSNSHGGIAKDVWVLAPTEFEGAMAERGRHRDTLKLTVEPDSMSLAPRVADDLFWLGRYAERAESTARLATVVDDLVADHHGRSGSPGQVAMREMVQALSQVTGVAAPQGDSHPSEFLRTIVFAENTPGTIAYTVSNLSRAAYAVRELLSPDTWLILSRLQSAINRPVDDDEPLPGVLAQVLECLVGLAGLASENTVRDEVWAFMDLGRRVERSLQVSTLLRVAIGTERSPVADGQITEATLRACDSVITFRRRLASGTGPASPVAGMLQLLLRDPINPRSLEFQFKRITGITQVIEDEGVRAAVDALTKRLEAVSPEDLGMNERSRLVDFCVELTSLLRDLSDQVSHRYFVRPEPPRRVNTIHEVGVRQ